MRSILRESHELVLKYCEETGQYSKYKSQSWFQFFRIIRNITSHKEGGNLYNWPNDLSKNGITSVKWKMRKLDLTMVGKNIEFSIPDAMDSWFELKEFVEKHLN